MFELRHYQKKAITDLYTNISNGIRRNIIWMPTGSGKGAIFCQLIEDAYKCGLPVVLVMRRRSLIEQSSQRLDEWGIPHGIYMAKHRRYDPKKLIQICSIDTLGAREIAPHSDKQNVIIIADECHDCNARSKKYPALFNAYNYPVITGLTATPFGGNELFEAIIKPIEAHELMEQGFLVPCKTFVPNIIDTSNVRIKRTGEYDEKGLFEAASNSEIVGNFVRDWDLYGQKRPTILFGVNIEHCKIIRDEFIKNGVKAIHCDASTPTRERERAFKDLTSGRIQLITNVNVFSTGVDVPQVSCIQNCRPTQSVIWHIQAIGRGLRPHSESQKENCIIIDNAGNTLRHGTAYKIREATIGKAAKHAPIDLEGDITIRKCNNCFYIFEANQKDCPHCGYINPPVERKIKQKDGDLIEMELSPEEQAIIDKKNLITDYHKLKWVRKRKYLPKKWLYDTLMKKYSLDLLKKHHEYIDLPKF